MCPHDRPPLYESFTLPSTRKTSEARQSPPKETNIPPPTVVAPVKLAAPLQPGFLKNEFLTWPFAAAGEVQASTKPGMEGVQETAGKIAVERKLQDEVSNVSPCFAQLLSSNTQNITFWFAGGAGVQHFEATGGDEDQWEVCQTDGDAGELM